MRALTLAVAAAVAAAGAARGEEIRVAGDGALRAAVGRLKPGTTLLLGSGTYRGGLYLRGVSGTAEARIVLRGADAGNPPLFLGGGSEGIHLADCNYVTLANLHVKGFPGNGINVDDGGTFDTPSRGVVIEDVVIRDTGPKGNHDALKLSGVDAFVVRRCRFEGWGGSAIDMVGCHDGLIEDCTFVGKPTCTQASGVQIKGGSARICVQTSFFHQAGMRAINLGGSTGLEYFRPKVGDCEAEDVTIAGNRFLGGMAPVAFVTADGGHVHHNTIVLPGKWVLRILQETRDGRFKPCRGGLFENNLVVCDASVRVFVNVGPGTAPETFTFRRNAWFSRAGPLRPKLPTAETDGVYDVDPKLDRIAEGACRATSKDPRLAGIGADAYTPPKPKQD